MMEKSKSSQYAKQATRESEGIIRQSQLQRSIELFQLFNVQPSLREVLRLSQILTDFQYSWEINHYEILKFEEHFKQKTNEKLLESVPHTRPGSHENKKDGSKSVSEYQSSVAKQLKGKV